MGAENRTSVTENIKFTGQNKKITYKQEQNFKKS